MWSVCRRFGWRGGEGQGGRKNEKKSPLKKKSGTRATTLNNEDGPALHQTMAGQSLCVLEVTAEVVLYSSIEFGLSFPGLFLKTIAFFLPAVVRGCDVGCSEGET